MKFLRKGFYKLGATQVTDLIKGVFSLEASDIVDVLNGAGFAAKEVAGVLKDVYNLGATDHPPQVTWLVYAAKYAE